MVARPERHRPRTSIHAKSQERASKPPKQPRWPPRHRTVPAAPGLQMHSAQDGPHLAATTVSLSLSLLPSLAGWQHQPSLSSFLHRSLDFSKSIESKASLRPLSDSPNRGISCSLTPLQIGSTGSNPQQPLPAKPPNPAGEQPRQFNAFPTDPRRRSPPIRRCQELPDPPPGQCCSAAGRDGWRRRRIAAPARPPAPPRALRSPWYDRLLPSSLAPFRCPRARFPLALRGVARLVATPPGRCSRALVWGRGRGLRAFSCRLSASFLGALVWCAVPVTGLGCLESGCDAGVSSARESRGLSLSVRDAEFSC